MIEDRDRYLMQNLCTYNSPHHLNQLFIMVFLLLIKSLNLYNVIITMPLDGYELIPNVFEKCTLGTRFYFVLILFFVLLTMAFYYCKISKGINTIYRGFRCFCGNVTWDGGRGGNQRCYVVFSLT